jgi:hypothetical protein
VNDEGALFSHDIGLSNVIAMACCDLVAASEMSYELHVSPEIEENSYLAHTLSDGTTICKSVQIHGTLCVCMCAAFY